MTSPLLDKEVHIHEKDAAPCCRGFVVQLAGLFLIHSVILKRDYVDTASVWRKLRGTNGPNLGDAAGGFDLCDWRSVDLSSGPRSETVDRPGHPFWDSHGLGECRLWRAERLGDYADPAHAGGEVDRLRGSLVCCIRSGCSGDLPTQTSGTLNERLEVHDG
jgi:hypothetical protein